MKLSAWGHKETNHLLATKVRGSKTLKSDQDNRVPFCPHCYKADGNDRFVSSLVSPEAATELVFPALAAAHVLLQGHDSLTGARPPGRTQGQDFEVLAGQSAEGAEMKWLLSRCLCRNFFISLLARQKSHEGFLNNAYMLVALCLPVCCTAFITKYLIASNPQLTQGWNQAADFTVILAASVAT